MSRPRPVPMVAARRRRAPSTRPVWRSVRAAGLALIGATLPAWSQSLQPLELRFGPEADYGPFVYAEADGQVRGLSVDLLALVAREGGLVIRTGQPQPLRDLLVGVRRGEIDLVSSLRPTPERGQYLAFSKPYVSVPAVLAMRAQDERAVLRGAGLWEALRGQSVAVGSGYAVEAFVRDAWPGVAWHAVRDDVEAVRGVLEGRHAAAVVDLASLAFVQRRHALQGVVPVDRVGFDYALSFGVRRDRPELLARIDEGLNAIPAAEKAQVVARWMKPLELPREVRRGWPVREIGLALLVAGLGLGWWGWRRAHRTQGGAP